MRQWLIILVALIGTGFIVYYFDKYRNRRYPESRPQNQGGNWDAFWAFLFPFIVFIMAIYFAIAKRNKFRAKTCVMWALGGMVFNAIWYLLFR